MIEVMVFWRGLGSLNLASYMMSDSTLSMQTSKFGLLLTLGFAGSYTADFVCHVIEKGGMYHLYVSMGILP